MSDAAAGPVKRWPLWAAAALALGAAAVATHLALASFRAAPAAGCLPGAAGCAAVLQSRFATWLGVPVAAPAALLYAVLAMTAAALALRRDRGALAGALFLGGGLAAAGAAIWFIGLQAIALGSFCATCTAIHVAGLTIGAIAATRIRRIPTRASAGALAAAGLLIAGLVAGHAASDPPEPRVSLLGGRLRVNPAEMPRLGPESAEHVVVALFDYTCPHCRRLEPMLEAAVAHFSPRVAVLPLVVPMDAACNPTVPRTPPRHANACAYARLALAVWHERPRDFPAFHRWLISATPSIEDARNRARRRFGPAVLEAQTDRAVRQRLRANVKLYRIVGEGQIPKVILSGNTVLEGTPPDAESLIRTFRERLGIAGGEPTTAPAQ